MSEPQPVEHHHRDGSLWARGTLLDGAQHGYWEWFRVDGSRMRSGSFDRGTQVGEWTTYDPSGAVVKVTAFPGPPGSATDHTSDDRSGSNTVVD
jgi:antitoxin component YwqK of YwqJK toxin-antitoxin module